MNLIKISDIGEFGLINRIHKLLDKEDIKFPGLGIGDDCAAFSPREDMELLVTCDSMVEGTHFLPEYISPLDVGRRAMVMNISDIGAMGGYPLYALISLGIRPDMPVEYIDSMYMGFINELRPFHASIMGGNVTKTDYKNFIDITLIGEVEADLIMRRSSAVEGDCILITGYPGQSAAGLKLLLQSIGKKDLRDHPLITAYNSPTHRAREGRDIAKSGYARAMIDTSDGLLGDLSHICEQSGVGAEIIFENLPVSEHMSKWDNAHEFIMGQSDDYELIITCDQGNIKKIYDAVSETSDVPVTHVGWITGASKGIKLVLSDGSKQDLTPGGWDHFKL